MGTTLQKVADFEVIDHGVKWPDYFQGCGVAFTTFDHCQTGIGDSIASALNDCLELIAQCGEVDVADLESRIIALEGEPSEDDTVARYCEPHNLGPDLEDREERPYHHISIRYS